MAGYSSKSLADKLGIKPGTVVTTLAAPPAYIRLLQPVPADVTFVNRLGKQARFIHCFVTRQADLEKEFPALARSLADDGMAWISWPKKAAKTDTDLTEDVVRKLGLRAGLVDVKVCAVDELWSGLKFVRRVADRTS
ncbi:MAG TPA: DUF3052 domain-containing protein [Gemmatimonadales bacterium]|jgi:hypothetical protein|nr:DUF3052 domain-containing protein [Gemmatimonadales bacterium]HXS25586.1 DUF3052 domain-containing protein [Gemmatimonadales bacterium]